jgi:hypothetical protein
MSDPVTPPTVSAVKWARTQAVICSAAPEPPPKLAWLAPTK